MRIPSVFLAVTVVALASAGAAAAESGVRIGYSERHESLDLRPAVGASSATSTMEFDAFGRRLAFELETNRSLVDAVAVDVPVGVEIYRGRIAGNPDSWARFVVDNGRPQGIFHDGSELYAVEAPAGPAGGAAPIVYRLADLEVPPGSLSCSHGGGMSAARLAASVAAMPGSGTAESRPEVLRALGAVSNLDMALVADFEFTDEFGSSTRSALLARMNIVDGIFSEQLGVQITVSHVDTYSSQNDPFSDETDANLLLDEVADFRFGSLDQRSAGLTHLFTGRKLDGNNVGVAFSSALCLSQFGAALTGTQNDLVIDALIAAHEIGHNFGAPHDNETGSACEATPGTFLMAPAVNGNDQFSACSIAEMVDDIAAASCIEALPANDVEVIPTGLPGTVNVGDRVTASFDVNNTGIQQATNVVLDITVPTIATFDSATASSGAVCTSGAGTVSCPLGTLASAAGVTVTVRATAASEGTASFTAAVSAEADSVAGNDETSVILTVGSASPPPSQPSAPSDGGGGGAPAWPCLLLLASLRLFVRRR